LSYLELQNFLLHREKKRVIFAMIKASKRECLRGEAALFGEAGCDGDLRARNCSGFHPPVLQITKINSRSR
jgi:hypothetical protein